MAQPPIYTVNLGNIAIFQTCIFRRPTPNGRVDHGDPAWWTGDRFSQPAMAILACEVALLALIDVAQRKAQAHRALEELFHLFNQVSINHLFHLSSLALSIWKGSPKDQNWNRDITGNMLYMREIKGTSTGWLVGLFLMFCWHHNKGCGSVYAPYILKHNFCFDVSNT